MQYACPVANCSARASLESDDDGKRLNQWILGLHDTENRLIAPEADGQDPV